jgi:prevent-host-death family protein
VPIWQKPEISIREANQHLSRCVDAVQDGAEIIITRRGVPVARLIGLQKSSGLPLHSLPIWSKENKQ